MRKVFIVQMSDSKKPVFPQVCVVFRDLGSEPLVALTMNDEEGRLEFYLYRLVKSNPDTLPGHCFMDIPAHHTCINQHIGASFTWVKIHN